MELITFKLAILKIWCFSALLLSTGPPHCQQVLAQDDKKLAIEIIAPRDASGIAYLPHGEAFEVRLSNFSHGPLVIWDDLCEFGHWTLSFNAKRADGHSQIVQKGAVPTSTWTNYPPKTTVIPPGKQHSMKVNLSEFFWGERAWLNAPEPNTGDKITMSALFEINKTDESKREGVWTGRIESASVVLPVLNPKLKTPQQYLWNACPQQALRVLKNDPSWINKRDDEDQCAPLHHAARFGFKEVVVWLLQNGADVNAAAYNQFTPLHFAHSKDIADILIKGGANLDQKDVWGKTALQSAAQERNTEVVDAILAAGYKMDLHTALLLKRRDVALNLLIHDANVIVGGDGGSDLGGNVTPLGLAATEGDLEFVKLLLEAGAPVNDPTDCVRYGGLATPLCNAVWAGKVEVVEFLLKRGAATDVVGGRFVRSLTEYAEKYSAKQIRALLAQYGGNPSLGNRRDPEKIRNKLPGRIASGNFKLPNGIK